MRALPLILLPAIAACVPAPTGEVPIGNAFPAAYRGTWSQGPACAPAPGDTGTVRIGARSLEGLGNLCTLVRASPAAGGGLLAEMTCAAGGGTRTELARLTLRGRTLAYLSEGGRADWTRCS